MSSAQPSQTADSFLERMQLPDQGKPRLQLVKATVEVEDWEDSGRLGEIVDGAPSALESAIDKSRFILTLNDDYDGEGSPGYERQTWERAVALLRRTASEIPLVDMPTIGPGPDGSIDLYWKTDSYTLLLNIRPGSKDISYYGKNDDGLNLEGDARTELIGAALILLLNPSD